MKKIRARVIALVLSALFISFLPVQSAFAYPSCTINGTAGNDVITGTAGNDVICAGGGNDTINSLAGNDTIIKGAGTAVINAGAGNDTIDAALATSVIIDAGTGDDIIIGSPGDDTIDAGDGMDDVEAGEGNDTLYGGSGDDSLDGGLGDNLLYGGAGDDIILGDEGKDTIYGDAGDDTIDGGDEADKLYGGAGNDTLIGGIDNDIVYGGDGDDYLYGDSGDDQLFGQAGIDTLSGQQGDDLLSGGTEIDGLSGGVGVNICDYTVGEATVSTCIYDSSAPVLSIVSISPDTVDVGSSASSVQIALSVTDATFISMAHIDCRRTGSTISIFSYDFNSSSFNGSASTNLSKTGDDKKLDVNFGATVSKGTTSGIYNCYLSSTDILGNSYQSEALRGFTIFGTPSQQPSTPRALTFAASGRTTGLLSWQAPTSLGSPELVTYVVQYSTDGTTWVDANFGTATKTSMSMTSLKADTNYWFRVRGENGGTIGQDTTYMNLAWANTTGKTAVSELPGVPSNFRASEISSSGLTIDWTAPLDNGGSAITNYSVEYSNDAGATWTNARLAASTSTQLKLSGLLPVTNYLFRIAAVTAFGKSPYLTGSVTTLIAQASAPTALTVVSVTSNKVTLAWSTPLANGGSAVTSYLVEVSSDSGSTWTVVPRAATDLLGITANSLQAGKTYLFRVSAVTSFGTGQATSPLSVATTQLSGPPAPRDFKVSTIKSTGVAVSWKAPVLPSGVKISNYLVDISLDGTNWLTVTKKVSTTASISISNLQVGTSYQLRVSTVATTGTSDYLIGYFTTLATVSAAPSLLTANEITPSSFLLSWLPGFNGGSAVTNYIVEINGAGSGWVTVPHDISANSSLLIQNLLPGVKYSARIKAVNSVGVSKVSTTLIVTTLPTVPSAPEALTLKSSTSALTVITWKAPNNGGAKVTDYQVKYSMDQGQTWSLMTKAVSTATLLNIRGLKAKNNYWFTVEAKNSAGFSVVSQVLRVSTP
ncbi:MAG: fibronectin type III domain-containing protein [Actinomycetes bacterium]